MRLLVFGHGGRGKGLAELCAALLSGDFSSKLHLVVAGERATAGVPGDLLARLAARLRVTVLDHYIDAQHVPDLFAGADLLLLPYLKVCKSPLLDLAAEFGVPVLRSDRVHAARFDENVHGVTVAHADVPALGTALGQLLQTPGVLSRMRERLRAEVTRVDHLDGAVARHLRLYASNYHAVAAERRTVSATAGHLAVPAIGKLEG
jgi:glycosyltransferase involved in cell wall biosynthesis